MKYTRLCDFAEERQIKGATISAYIRRHNREFSGHVRKKGKYLLLDIEAIRLLNDKYPLPRPVEVIQDTTAREELAEAHKMIIKLQEQLLSLRDSQYLLETQENKIKVLEEELEQERRKSWLDKLLKK